MKVAELVRSRADLYVHAGRGMKHWDSCGPEALLAAAGGRLSDLDGAPIDYRDHDLGLKRGLLASNGVLHPGILSAVAWAEREVERVGSAGDD
jgi:3'(2'), 5'-bisphosphate nucleotidase